MENIVELYQGKEARVKTFDLFKGFGYTEHRQIKKVIKDNFEDFKDFGDVLLASTDASKIKQHGRHDESFYLNEEQFTLRKWKKARSIMRYLEFAKIGSYNSLKYWVKA